MKIAVLYKGRSPEKDVSCKSGKAIAKALESLHHNPVLLDPADFSYQELIKKIKSFGAELVFCGLHGGEGENGQLQALLELEQIPFTGSGSKACAVAMDKFLCERLVSAYNIPIAQGKLLSSASDCQALDFLPAVVKPNDAGSSVGITMVEDSQELLPAVQAAFACSSTVICQEFIKGRELTVPILGQQPLPVIEIEPERGFFDYQNKYTKGCTKYTVPAKLNQEQTSQIQHLALLAHQAVGAQVYSRVDFRYDGKRFYFLEVNTLPGMTATSLVPMAAKAIGMSFDELVDKILRLSQAKESKRC